MCLGKRLAERLRLPEVHFPLMPSTHHMGLGATPAPVVERHTNKAHSKGTRRQSGSPWVVTRHDGAFPHVADVAELVPVVVVDLLHVLWDHALVERLGGHQQNEAARQ